MNYLDDSTRRKVIFLTGKGGVGKSTLAWATALACKRRGKRTAVVGWKPLGKEVPVEDRGDFGIPWIGLDTLTASREYALQIIRFEKLYDTVLDNKVLRTFVLAAPGLADAVMAGKIWDLYQKDEYDTIVVDMPSSGHAKSFFKSPLGLQKIFKVGFIARDAERVLKLFRAPDVRLDLVALPEELPLVECRELKQSLEALHPFSWGYLHLNQCLPDWVCTPGADRLPVDDAVKTALEDLNARWTDQHDTLALAEMGLPRLQIPRFATEAWKQSVEDVAKHLEGE